MRFELHYEPEGRLYTFESEAVALTTALRLAETQGEEYGQRLALYGLDGERMKRSLEGAELLAYARETVGPGPEGQDGRDGGRASRIELPLTPPMAELVEGQRVSSGELTRLVIAVPVALAVLVVGLAIALGGGSFQGPIETVLLALIPILGIGAIVLWRIDADRTGDKAAGSFVRATGPMQVVYLRRTLRLPEQTRVTIGGQRLQIYDPNGRAVSGLNWGTVDYTPRGKLVLEIRDAADRPVYRAPGYDPRS